MSSTRTTYTAKSRNIVFLKVAAYFKLLKFRLSFLVVFSAIFSYLMAPSITGVDPMQLVYLFLGGFMVTGASNVLNQVLEVEYDKLMSRTAMRPLPTGVVSPSEAVVYALLMGGGGILILGFMFEGWMPALLGIIALLSYAFVYTPLKRVSSISVLVGAIPGSMPLLIGWAAAEGELGPGAWVLFLIQFLWQFPHFWALAWMLEEDYQKAGFKMLPSNGGRSAYSAFLILTYTVLLIPAGLLPLWLGLSGSIGSIVLVVLGLYFSFRAVLLLRSLGAKAARHLFFTSLMYLPLMQITLLIDKF